MQQNLTGMLSDTEQSLDWLEVISDMMSLALIA
jgi:hypothetical protein